MVKIQVTVLQDGFENHVPVPEDLEGWADLVNMQPLHTVEEANQWMVENKISDLEVWGLKFRVVVIPDEQLESMPEIEIVSAEELDPEVLEEIEAQLLSGELDEQGNPRITFHLNDEQHILGLVDEKTLEKLDADWDQAKTAGTG